MESAFRPIQWDGAGVVVGVEQPSTELPHLNREQRRSTFKREKRHYRLTFEGSPLDGLVVVIGGVPVGTMLQMAEMAALVDSFTPENIGTLGLMFQILSDSIVEWNLVDDDDQPVPPTMEGVRSLDLDEAMLLIQQWMQHTAGVSGPLDQGSTGGVPSGVASIPMDVESPSHLS